MSKIIINQYYQNLDRAIQFGKSRNETSIRNYFWNLLNEYARKQNYELVTEVSCMGTRGKKVYPDGIVKNLWGLDIGLWESKDEKDDIEAEIDAKIKKGYPLTNILFEDSHIAILFQRGEEVGRVKMRDADKLDELLNLFVSFKSETVYKFEEAIEKFKADIPAIVETLRYKIDGNSKKNPDFIHEFETFLELCKVEINPAIAIEDIREMMIQHILTSDIFNKIFDDGDFHRHNTIAAELEKLSNTLFSYADRRNLLNSIDHYYEAINATAAGITDHHEKQKFLKVLYENFYKVYNPKAADRLGVVYTPNEIVQFMVKSTDYLLHKHFGKTLADRNVEILDPATGTGTFICEIIENAIPKQDLDYKFKNELHANEVAILPYYIANLNIEYTFKQKMQYYAEFPNICFVDTLDNTEALAYSGKQHDLFGLSSENSDRIKRQNSKKISVIIGNPPYNANQLNENENNKNREYPIIDKRIKETYIKHSKAQKTKVYDMYARFYRWASDRVDKNGVLAMITNRSFIESRTFDGFRKVVASEFNAIYIVDLGGDVRANPKLSGTKHNVFGIQTGVAIMILVRRERNIIEAQTREELEELKEDLNISAEPVVLYKEEEYFSTQGCRIYYYRRPEMETAYEKLVFLRNSKIENLEFDRITPDKNNNWINLTEDNDWESFLKICSKDSKGGKCDDTIFKLFSLGIATNRDEWVYDFDEINLQNKVKYFCEIFDKEKTRWNDSDKTMSTNDFVDRTIKWTEELEKHLVRNSHISFDQQFITKSTYRPFVKKSTYYHNIIIHRPYQQPDIFPYAKNIYNPCILTSIGGRIDYSVFVSNVLPNLAIYSLDAAQCLPLHRYDKSGNRTDNISDWGLAQFINHYNDDSITKENIFHYTYAVLHNPAYRKKYELNLKREFPRLPFYDDFRQWTAWGKALMELHIAYETIEPYYLEVITSETKAEAKRQKEIFSLAEEPQALFARQPKIKAKLKAIKTAGIIEIDEITFITGIPAEAWEYKLGNRSAIEWILDQYKEKKPTDPTIAEKFNTYRFADYKDQVIDLLKRVCTVSVETMKIVRAMEECSVNFT
jgi:predicted helicase